MSEINPYVSKLFDLANTFAPPLVKAISSDRSTQQNTTQAAASTLNEQIQWARLNGSGPADPSLAAQQAPTTLAGFISGSGNATQQQQTKSDITKFLWVGALFMALIYFMKRG